MLRQKIKQPKYRLWSPTTMTNALQKIREDNISVRKAAKLYNVPLTTLRDRVDGRISHETLKSGPETLFTQEEEARIVQFVSYMAELGYGFTRSQLLEVASDLAVHIGKRDRSHPLSMFWFYDFLGRWPELHVVKPRGLASVRARSASPEIVKKYFDELKSTLTKYDLSNKPHLIYNLDEKGISTEHRPPNVVSPRSIQTQSITSPRGANTTIIGCGNALGQQIPPLYIFAGKRMRDELLNGCLPGTDGTVTETGWSNSEVFELYLKDHFQKFVNVSPDNPVLLLFDGHASHLTLSVIEWAKERGIILFVFPPHCSHILQPMDVGCFGPLQKIYNKECSSYLRSHPGQTIGRLNVCEISSKAYSKALSPENLRSAFKKSGVYPYNPSALDESKLTPSKVYDYTEIQPVSTTSSETQPVHDEPIEHVGNVQEESPPSSPLLQRNNNCAQFENCSNENVVEFFSARAITAKQTQVKKGKKRKSIHPIVSGRAVTEDIVIQEMKKYKETCEKSGPKKSVKSTKKANETRRDKSNDQSNGYKLKKSNSKLKSVAKQGNNVDSQQPGPSAYYVANSENEDYDSETVMSDKEEDLCCVCHKFSPPGLSDCIDIVITKWGRCDNCSHWTHLRFCTEIRVLRRHSTFLCPCCVN